MKALRFAVSVPQFLALKVLGPFLPRLHYRGPLATVRLDEIPEPPLPSPAWVKIRTHLCGFCGSDQSLIFLRDSPTASPFTSFPCVLGHELSGEIVEAGKDVRRFAAGERVTVAPSLGCAARGIDPPCRSCRMGKPSACENTARGSLSPGMFSGICRDVGGGFAPFLTAHESQLFRLPEGATPETGAMIEPLAVTLEAVLENRPDQGDKVLIIGGGVIGNLLVQSIRALGIGCHITVSEPSRFHAELAAKEGADAIVTDGDLFGHVPELTEARRYRPMLGREIFMGGFTKVFDVVGKTETLRTAMRIMAGGGCLSVVGIGDEVRLDLTPLWLKLQTIRGVYGYGYHTIAGERLHAYDLALRLVREGKVRLDAMITHRFPLEQYREMIAVNRNKTFHRAVKTVVSFLK
ncbi:MAG: alcohol dehydrogenase catalytic domain-containing protein [Deltaproteobacteria bacterium]|nr:alcohol dehydrogenase catalytic domain-containing protein [Deltaproteobacteria bacterium]